MAINGPVVCRARRGRGWRCMAWRWRTRPPPVAPLRRGVAEKVSAPPRGSASWTRRRPSSSGGLARTTPLTALQGFSGCCSDRRCPRPPSAASSIPHRGVRWAASSGDADLSRIEAGRRSVTGRSTLPSDRAQPELRRRAEHRSLDRSNRGPFTRIRRAGPDGQNLLSMRSYSPRQSGLRSAVWRRISRG
jgi:hypothetical protein